MVGRSRWSGGMILRFRVICWRRCGISRSQMEDLLQSTTSDLGRRVALELVDRGWRLHQFSRVRLGMMHGLMGLMMHWAMRFVMDVMDLMMFAMHNRVMAHMTDSMAYVVITSGNAHGMMMRQGHNFYVRRCWGFNNWGMWGHSRKRRGRYCLVGCKSSLFSQHQLPLEHGGHNSGIDATTSLSRGCHV